MDIAAQQKYTVGQRVYMPAYGIARISGTVTEKIGGAEIDLFILRFESRNDVFAAEANEKSVRKIPSFKADTAFVPLPSKKDFKKIIEIATASAQTTSGRWKTNQEKFSDALKSGDLFQIASVYRKTKMEIEAGEEPSYSKKILYEQALKTLSAAYAEVFQVDFAAAKDFFFKEKILPSPQISSEETTAQDEPKIEITSPVESGPKPDDYMPPKSSVSAPGWDIPVQLAFKISTCFNERTRILIVEKLKVKMTSHLFNLTSGDWPMHAPATVGISTAEAQDIQNAMQNFRDFMSKKVA